MPKNIVVFSDGTGQEGGEGHNTNVYKLFNLVEDRTSRQIAFYDRGLGTGWRRLSGSVAGAGISKNIQECYQFIFENYEVGDKVYLIGFSRGAFTVRSLSGFLHLVGILPKSRPELIPPAYEIYRTRDLDERKARAKEFLSRHRTIACEIEAIGVWDTVAALGVPYETVDVVLDRIPWFRHEFHNAEMCANVRHGYHALATDDERLVFHPTLWDESAARQDQTIEQVWFAGMHSDVGGGYREVGLSDITLQWMIDKLTPHGLQLSRINEIALSPNADGVMHDSRGGLLSRLYRRRPRSVPAGGRKPRVHQSVVDRKRNPRNEAEPPYRPWILQGQHDVEPW